MRREEGADTKHRILAVDDEPHIVRLIKTHLERQGYVVDTAGNGVEALDRVERNRPDLLISDLMMPEMDGFELLHHIRSIPDLKGLPFIMLPSKPAEVGAKTDPESMRLYCKAGADLYLTKPFSPAELIAHVQKLLGE